MIVTVTPAGREPFDVQLTDEPRYTDKARGGYDSATVPCVVEPWMLDRLLDARVQITSTAGEVWAGWVWAYGSDGLECVGQQSRLGLLQRRAMYAKTDFLQDLKEFNYGTNYTIFDRSVAEGVVRFTQREGSTAATNDYTAYIYFGDVLLTSLTFTAIVVYATFGLRIRPLDSSGNVIAGSEYANDTPGTHTGQSITFPAGTYGFLIMAYSWANVTATDSFRSAYTYSMTLHAVDITPTPSNVVKDVLGRLPASDYPTSTAALRFIATDESTPLPRLDVDGSEADVINTVCDLTGRDFGFWSRDVDGLPWPVGIYRARPTTPAYHVCHDGNVVKAALRGATMADMRSRGFGRFTDADGRQRYVRVTDTDPSHYLVRIGRIYDERVDVDTDSIPTATTATTAVVAAKSAITHGGTVEITGTQVTDADGAPVHPSKLESGNLIAVSGTAFGEVVGYIESTSHIGEDTVTLTLDDSLEIPVAIRRIVRG